MKSAKECVTTHLPNLLALKMDGAQVGGLYAAIAADARPQCVGGLGVRAEA